MLWSVACSSSSGDFTKIVQCHWERWVWRRSHQIVELLCLCACRLLNSSPWREPGRLWRWLRRNCWALWGWRPSTLSTAQTHTHAYIYCVPSAGAQRGLCIVLPVTWSTAASTTTLWTTTTTIWPGASTTTKDQWVEQLPPVLRSWTVFSSLLAHHDVEHGASSPLHLKIRLH